MDGKLTAFLPTADPPTAKRFFTEVLEFALQSEDPSGMVFDAGGTMLRVATVEAVQAAPYTVLSWEVADITRTVRELVGRGVAFRRYDGLEQDPDGIWEVPGAGARVAWFMDPDGSVLSLTQARR